MSRTLYRSSRCCRPIENPRTVMVDTSPNRTNCSRRSTSGTSAVPTDRTFPRIYYSRERTCSNIDSDHRVFHVPRIATYRYRLTIRIEYRYTLTSRPKYTQVTYSNARDPTRNSRYKRRENFRRHPPTEERPFSDTDRYSRPAFLCETAPRYLSRARNHQRILYHPSANYRTTRAAVNESRVTYPRCRCTRTGIHLFA